MSWQQGKCLTTILAWFRCHGGNSKMVIDERSMLVLIPPCPFPPHATKFDISWQSVCIAVFFSHPDQKCRDCKEGPHLNFRNRCWHWCGMMEVEGRNVGKSEHASLNHNHFRIICHCVVYVQEGSYSPVYALRLCTESCWQNTYVIDVISPSSLQNVLWPNHFLKFHKHNLSTVINYLTENDASR